MLTALTALARARRLFSDLGVEDYFTFFDLAKLLRFKQITVTDGKSFAHRVVIR